MILGRKVATAGLLVIGAMGAGAAYWSGAQILDALSAFAECRAMVTLSTNSFMIIGAISWLVLPFFSIRLSERGQKRLLGLLIFLFLALPFGAFLYTDWVKDTQGYVVAAGSWSPIARNVVDLQATDCIPAAGRTR